MPSEHSRSSSGSSATSVPTINIKRAPTPPNNNTNNSNNEQLLDAINARLSSQSKDRNREKSTSRARSRSSSRGKSPARKSDKRGKSPSPGRKSPSGEKLLSTSKNSGSNRSRSPSPRPKSPGRNNSSRSKSPRNNHNRVGSDNSNNKSSSQDARVGLGSKILHPWVAPSLNLNGEKNNSKSANRLSLPNFPDNASLNAMRERNEILASKLNLVPSESKGMGNFSKPSNGLRVVSGTRPKLHVETFSHLFGSKAMQRTQSGQRVGKHNDSPLVVAGGLPLNRSRSHNAAMDSNNTTLPASFLKELEKTHPLQHSWTMYYDSKPVMTPGPKTPTGMLSYEENLQTIGTFDLVETFCRYFNWVKKPSQLELNTNFHIFKDKIKPMWEDPANANGGKWVISMRNPPLLDRCWTWLVCALVGEELDENDDICGAVMSRRIRGDRIAVWVRDKDNVAVINGIGRRLLKILDLQNEKGIGMDFQFNEDALKSGTSYNNRVYLSLESLKQELENEEKARLEELAKSAKRQSITIDDSKTTTPDIVTIDVDAQIDAANAKIKLSDKNNKENGVDRDDNQKENDDCNKVKENGDYQNNCNNENRDYQDNVKDENGDCQDEIGGANNKENGDC
ncbi:eukaryotic translation initiation factor 4e class ii [Gigaspora margarita]|uniref:Eukaryotic translation initiation factor 4e class ii n=1 Tax=Gigaspora margarita TaxID=4874 RepID=A0A8H4A2Y4_GIGMA|nr:eukaryotic translation initiation factor 4e class ii [Gigaspora margarita]